MNSNLTTKPKIERAQLNSRVLPEYRRAADMVTSFLDCDQHDLIELALTELFIPETKTQNKSVRERIQAFMKKNNLHVPTGHLMEIFHAENNGHPGTNRLKQAPGKARLAQWKSTTLTR